MGKKSRNHEKGGKGRVVEEDDYVSGEEGEDGMDIELMAGEAADNALDTLLSLIDKLSEKRSSARIKAMSSIVELLRSSSLTEACIDHLNRNTMSLESYITKGLRVGGQEREGIASAELLCVLALIVGPDEDEWVHIYNQPLDSVILESESDEFRAWCITAKVFMTLVCAEETDAGRRCLTLCESIFCDELGESGVPVGPLLCAAALNSWCIMAQHTQDDAIITRSKERVFAAALNILENPATDPNTKISAGECLAFLWEVAESNFTSGIQSGRIATGAIRQAGDWAIDHETADLVETAESVAFQLEPHLSKPELVMDVVSNGHLESSVFGEPEKMSRKEKRFLQLAAVNAVEESKMVPVVAEMEPIVITPFADGSIGQFNGCTAEQLGVIICPDAAVVERAVTQLKNLAHESSKKVAKKDRKEIRLGFRALEAWVIKGESPSERVRVKGASIEANSFGQIKTLDMIRMILVDGLHCSLKTLPIVRDMLGVTSVGEHNDGDGERVVVAQNSRIGKARANDIKKQRRIKTEITYDGMDEEE